MRLHVANNDRESLTGPELRRLRQAAGLTLREVAADLHLSVSHLSRVERDARPVGLRIHKGYLDVTSTSSVGPTDSRRPSIDAVSRETVEVHLLENGDCDYYDHSAQFDVLTQPYAWPIDAGPRNEVALYAYDVLEGNELQYEKRGDLTQISMPLAPGPSSVTVRVYPPADINILTFGDDRRQKLEAFEFVVHVPQVLVGSLDLRRIADLPPGAGSDGDIPLRFQRPILAEPVTRIGFDRLLAGCSYGIGWQDSRW